MADRDRDRESISSFQTDSASAPTMTSSSNETSVAAVASNIDVLFEVNGESQTWEPTRPPQVLGELLDSRHMLPLNLPSDPRLLALFPSKPSEGDNIKSVSSVFLSEHTAETRSPQQRTWKSQYQRLRKVKIGTLNQLDGAGTVSRWTKPVRDQDDDSQEELMAQNSDDQMNDPSLYIHTNTTPLTKRPSVRRPRASQGGDVTPI
jgi:hypothetical protein